MGVDKFKFISPGIFIDEIDESILEPLPERMGPLIVGRFPKGPSGRPIKVNSFREFVSVFGNPEAGNPSGDVWRSGEMTAPTYASYAAQAWLKNNSPATVYRVLGENRSDASTVNGTAGWKTSNTFASPTSVGGTGGAYGLFVMPNPDSYTGGTQATAVLAFSGKPSETRTITLTDFAGTSLTFEVDDDGNGVVGSNIALAPGGSGAAAMATELASEINGESTLGITAAVTDSTKVTLTMDTAGTGGNKAITTDFNNTTGDTTTFTGGSGPEVTGTLAAVWYVDGGAIVLSGTARDGTQQQGAGILIKDNNGQYTAKVTGSEGVVKTATFDFTRDSKTFIRKVFNTNPTVTNTSDGVVNTNDKKIYWLGETFESNITTNENSQLKVGGEDPSGTDKLGVILALDGTQGGSNLLYSDHKQAAKAAQTGWFFSQDLRGGVTASFDPTNSSHVSKLFKLHALDSGEHANRDYKISIQDIKVPTDNFNAYGTFTVLVRKGTDSDNKPVVLERFSGVNLDPTSLNYIARVIGDRHYYYSEDNKTITDLGNYPNRSDYVRVEVSNDVNNGAAKDGWLPFGVYGPVVPKTLALRSGSVAGNANVFDSNASLADIGWVEGSGALPNDVLRGGGGDYVDSGQHGSGHLVYTSTVLTASLEFPTTRLRVSSSEGGMVKGTKAYFGYQSTIKDTKRHDFTNIDLCRGMPAGIDPHTKGTSNQYSWVFTLDDLKEDSSDTNHSNWIKDSRANGTSYTALSGTTYVLTGSKGGYKRFTSPMFGGFDGWDVREADPLRNGFVKTTQGELTNYAYYSLKKAIDITSDAEYVEYDIAVMPGVKNSSLNTQLINSCEERGDAIAIVDTEGNYVPPHADNRDEKDRLGAVEDVVTTVKDMGLNSSYGCTFYPWVQIRDTISDSILYVPPSIVALGTFSSSQRKSAVWFAPAGFTRGGLTEGSAGLPVLGVRQRLTSDNRDRLYEANVNPIASFPAEGLVIFGQKTLQVTPSALDRINVRRLMIHVKKEISRMASTLLFEQNVQATWNRFKGKVEPFLRGIQAGLGLVDFKVVLDDTTTTPDLIDRNILYAKIFLKPARAIEFIALDFIITKSGASFDD
tara:strand:+ start:4722 stop:8021 length:3300 start_codon:yes stop_codon:yes gene_type:complete